MKVIDLIKQNEYVGHCISSNVNKPITSQKHEEKEILMVGLLSCLLSHTHVLDRLTVSYAYANDWPLNYFDYLILNSHP